MSGYEQLAFDLDALRSLLAERLRDRRRIPASGAERLLVELVRRGLDEDALPVAALLTLTLDDSRHEA